MALLTGAAFAGMSAVETLCGLLGSTVFNPIYSATVSSFRGMVFLVMAGMELCGLVFIMYVYLQVIQNHLRCIKFNILINQYTIITG